MFQHTRTILLLFGFVCGGLAFIGSSLLQPLTAQPLPDRRDFIGRILDDGGKPLIGATVTIRPPSDLGIGAFWGAQTTTDDNGEFRVPEVEDGRYVVSVTQDGFAPVQDRAFVLSSATPRLNAALVRLVIFKAKILDKAGEPLGSTQLAVRLRGNDLKVPSLDRRAATTKDGELNLPSLVPGQYTISVIASGAGYGVLPNVEINQKTSATLSEIRLQAGGALQVSAREKVADGKPLGGAVLAISLLPDDAAARAAGQIKPPEDVGLFLGLNDRYSLISDESGTLKLTDIPTGLYSVRLLMPGRDAAETQQIEIKPDTNASLNFIFPADEKALPLTIQLQDQKEKPLVDMQWRMLMRQISGSGPPPQLPGGGGLPPALMQDGYLRQGATNEKGQSTLYPLQAGRWRLTLTPAKEEFAKRVPPVTQEVDISEKSNAVTFQLKVPEK